MKLTYLFVIILLGLSLFIFSCGGDDDDNDGEENIMAFRMIEVITGLKDDGYTEIHLINSLPENTQVVMNAAYYLLADMKKEETEHEH